MPNYRLPTLILTVNVWRFGNPTSNAPDVIVLANLIPGRRHVIETAPAGLPPSDWLPASFLLLAIDADVRDEAGNNGEGDTVEVPAGSGRFYWVQYVEYVGLGFANQHKQAVIVKNAIFPFPDFDHFYPPVLGITVEVLIPSYNLGEGAIVPLLGVTAIALAPAVGTTPNVTLSAPLPNVVVETLTPAVSYSDAHFTGILEEITVEVFPPTVEAETVKEVLQTVTDHNIAGVNHYADVLWTSTPTAGNTLIACFACNTNNPATITVTSPWVQVFQQITGVKAITVAACIATGLEVTTGPLGGGDEGTGITIWEVSGLAGSVTVDKTATAASSSSASDSTGTTATTTQASEFACGGLWTFGSQPTWSGPTNGFTLDGQTLPPVLNAWCGVHKILTSTGTIETTLTASSACDYIGCVVTFK